uniref:Uncharacterized protein n=1 Tax=Arundo donax TaxID=35708 RepID=A0A0A8Z369_ARUDO
MVRIKPTYRTHISNVKQIMEATKQQVSRNKNPNLLLLRDDE